MLTPNQKIGLCGERWVCGQIEQLALRCRILPDFTHPGADLIVEERLYVEVKYARTTERRTRNRSGSVTVTPRWQWNLSRLDRFSDKVLVLVAEDVSGRCWAFIMPMWIMIDRSHFQITSHPTKYRGVISDFFQNWPVLQFMLQRGWARGEPGPWAEVRDGE